MRLLADNCRARGRDKGGRDEYASDHCRPPWGAQLHHGTDSSQIIPVSPPIGAPGGASGTTGVLAGSYGRSRKRLMSSAIARNCAASSPDAVADPARWPRADNAAV